MSKDEDISKLRKLLKLRGHEKLADFLLGSRSFVNESNTFGSRWYSTLSSFEIHSPVEKYEELKGINPIEKDELMKCILTLYPLKDDSPEIKEIEFFPDVDLISDDIVADTEALNLINFDYVREQISKCKEKINVEDYDGAVTNARTLLESVCLYILDEEGIEHEHDGNLIKLYKKVSKELNMDPNDFDDKNLKTILSGVFSIVNGVSSIRNSFGDAHGVSPKKYYKINKRHALLTVNLSSSLADFLFQSYLENRPKTFKSTTATF